MAHASLTDPSTPAPRRWRSLLALGLAFGAGSARAEEAAPRSWSDFDVRITPLGSHAGELCSRDRATLFEDPTGVRILDEFVRAR